MTSLGIGLPIMVGDESYDIVSFRIVRNFDFDKDLVYFCKLRKPTANYLKLITILA